MTSVEKRRSSRKSGGRRKHSDGGFSDTSSGGSFMDEADREVSNLTDRAFRSLCIGEEAVYNDSDFSLSSPSTQRDRQLAFSQDRELEEKDREEQKRVAHENFSLRVQQYGHDWILGGMCGADVNRDPQWENYAERTQGMVSATFQHSFMETSRQGKSLREEELSVIRNGSTELSSQQCRSHSRVSSLVRAFNSEGHGDGAGIDNSLREWSEGTSWDRSALMSIQKELSEFSTSYQQNINSHLFASASQFAPQDTHFYSSPMGAMAQMSHSSASSYMRSSHIKHNMSTEVSCNSNFFMHSEFSPFRLWRDHNRFPFQQGDISGFMQRSEFPKWYETPMYREPSLGNQPQGFSRDPRYPRNNLALGAPPIQPASTSAVLQKASTVEKRCESDLSSHDPHRRWTQNLGTNKLPSQRPSTASPTTEMSRRVRDTISSVKTLQQKLKMMSEQNMTAGGIVSQQGIMYGNENVVNAAVTLEPNVFSSDTRTCFSSNQLLTPSGYAYQEAKGFQQHEVSPQPMEHPPVRAESRGATPDVRMSSYKSRATSLLFNLKDNRKRVKSTYSPTKLKGLDPQEKNKQPLIHEQHEPARENPVFSDPETQLHQLQEPRRTNAVGNQYHSPGLSLPAQINQPERIKAIQYPENTQTQGQMVHHTGFNGLIPENDINNQLANGQNPHENLAPFTPSKQDHLKSMEQPQPFYSDTARLNTENNQSREYLISKANSEQAFNETVGRVFSKVDRYEKLHENKQIHKNVASQDTWRQTNNEDTGNFCQGTAMSQVKQDPAPLLERSRQENESCRGKELENVELRESWIFGTSSLKKADLFSSSKMSNQPEIQQRIKTNEMKDDSLMQKYNRFTDQEQTTKHNVCPATDKPMAVQRTGPIKQFMPVHKEHEKQESQFDIHKNLLTQTMTHQVKDKQFDDNKDGKILVEQQKSQDVKAEPVKSESVRFTTAEKITSRSEKIQIEESKLDQQCERLTKDEQIKEEQVKKEQDEQFREKELYKNKQMKAEKNIIQPGTDESKGTEQVEYEHVKEKQVKAEETETEKLHEEKTSKIEPTAKTEMKHDTDLGTRKMTNPEQVQQEQLSTEQVAGQPREAEQRQKTEKRKTEQAEVEHRQAEKTKEKNPPQTETKHTQTGKVKAMEVKTNNSEVENIRQVKDEKDSTSLAKDSKHEESKPEQAKLEEKKLIHCRTDPSKTENLQERSDKLTAKLTATHIRQEPDKVEQVKTELAKAKAELAKIKEKMRGEQVRNNPTIKDEIITKINIPLSLNKDKNKLSKKQEEPVEVTHRVADDYERLREKYGFTNAVLTAKSKESTTSLTSNDANKTEVLSVATENNEKSLNEPDLASSFMTTNVKTKKEICSSKHSEVKESPFVHGESSKEAKLSNSFPTNLSIKSNGDSVAVKLKDDADQKLETYDSEKEAVLQQEDSTKLCLVQRKPELHEHSTGSGKDLPIIPPKALAHKEKAQTKQEILTSKIKAHAEKEISAIKEKGFALREGFIGKSSTKHLASGQTVNICQKPPSQEMHKNHESTQSNGVSLNNQMDPSGGQTDPLLSSAKPAKSAATNPQLKDHLEKPAKPNHATTSMTNITESKTQKEVSIKSPVQSKKQTVEKNQEKEQVSHTELPGRQNEAQQADTAETLEERKEDQTQAGSVKAANSKLVTTEKVEGEEDVDKDSEPPDVVIGQEEAETDESLQIVGIMVTIRERTPPMTSDQEENGSEKQTNAAEFIKSELNENQRREENTSSMTVCSTEGTDVKKTHAAGRENPGKGDINSFPKNVQETSTWKPKKRDLIEKDSQEKKHQQDKSTMNVEAVTTSAKAEALTETQTTPFKQDTEVEEPENNRIQKVKESSGEIKRNEENNQPQRKPAHVSETSSAKVVKSEINNSKVSIKEPPVKDLSPGNNNSKISNTDTQTVPLPEEKMFDSIPPESFNSSNNSSDYKNRDVDVHIDRIAIRVVPALTNEDNVNNIQEQAASSSSEEAVIDLNNEHFLNNFPSTSSEEMKETLEDKLAVQHVLSSVRKLLDSLKASSKQHSNPNVPPVEGDYFQVQGVTETSNKAHNNLTTAEDKLKERELPGLLPNKTATSHESNKEGGSEVFVFRLDRSEMKSSSGNVQDESILKKKLETEDKLLSKQTDGSVERRSNKEKREAIQSNHIRKNHEEKQISRNSHPTKAKLVHETTESNLKPKARVSTIPEISAIADYARLKVIVSEDREVPPAQEFPPSKREGFFPLIQTRHSRRPVFTDESRDLSVKDKKLPDETETSPTATKEPKTIAFPIMEKELQRTGMFKLGDKEKQEKMTSDAKTSTNQSENVENYSSHKDTNKSRATQKEQVTQTGIQKPDSSISQVTTQNNKSSEGLINSNVNILQHAALGQTQNQKENHPKKVEILEKQDKYGGIQSEDGRAERQKNEKVITQHETKRKQQDKQLEEEHVSRCEKEKSQEDIRAKLEERRTSLAEEEKRVPQREEGRRAREREAIDIMIKERREKQRQSEVRTGEERANKKKEENVIRKEEEVPAKQKVESITTETEKKRIKTENERLERLRWEENERRIKKQKEERSAQEEQQRRAVEEEQRRVTQVEQQRRLAQEEQRRPTAYQERQKKEAEERERRDAQKEQQRKAVHEERVLQEEQKIKAAQVEQQRREAEEHRRRAEQEIQHRRAAQTEEQRQAEQIKEKMAADILEKKKIGSKEKDKTAFIPQEERIKQIREQKKIQPQIEDLRKERFIKEQLTKTQKKEDEGIRVAENKTILKQRDENQAKRDNAILPEKNIVARDLIQSERDKDTQAKKKEEEEEKTGAVQEREKRAIQKMDTLQYYAITSTDMERKPPERQSSSPSPSQQKHNQLMLESTDDSLPHAGPYRPHTAASPASSLPRSNTSSPAPGAKPLMFRVKDNTIRGSTFTKSVKPRFYKNFGEDFRMGSDRTSDRAEEEQEMMRRRAGTPASPEKGLNRFAGIGEPSAFLSASSSQDYSTSISHQRPYSRRSMALDDEESHSVVSNMSEDVESFATSAADLSDVRGLFDFERPESACSFSSDVSRNLGKPPAVPPKSEKALRRAQRLTSRRIKKELSKAAAESPAGVEKESSSFPSSSEVCSSNHHAVASPHFSPPVAFAHAPALGSNLSSPHAEHQSSHYSFHASPHATGPISLPISTSHVASSVPQPSVSLHASGNASKIAAPKTVAHVSSSSTPHLANHQSTPVTQYHVEPGQYHQSYPLTQHKVLQDLGSGQYFLVEVPVQVKTKTFIDPQTGKYVQLNVRQSGQNISQAQPQQAYPHPQLQPQMQIKQQQLPPSQASNAGKPFVLYQGYHSYPTVLNAVHANRSSVPHQHQQPPRESHVSTEVQPNSHGHRYSPEKTPYMDTVSNINRTNRPVNNSHDSNESFPEFESHNQLVESSVCETNSANSRYQPRDIITMSELEDFMEASDW